MSTIPTFQVDAATPIDLKLAFTGLTNFSIALGDWNDAASKWIPRTPYIATNKLSHNKEDYPAFATVGADVTLLLVISLSMTSLGGAAPVSTVAELSQKGLLKGQVSTPPTTPGASQAASVTMQIFLRGV
jgi:hypothetical protein